jgi:hypothetical protein
MLSFINLNYRQNLYKYIPFFKIIYIRLYKFLYAYSNYIQTQHKEYNSVTNIAYITIY